MILAAGLSPAWQQTLLFDSLRVGEVNRAREAHWTASGKVVNAGRALHILGRARRGPSARTLAVLGGLSGEAAERSLAGDGVDLVLVRTATRTRTCTTVIARGQGTITELVENAGPVAPAELDEFRARFRELARGAEAVVVTGSLPAGAGAGYYRSLLEGMAAPVVLDARGPELLEALALRPFLVKPNREELGMTLGGPLQDEAALRAAMEEISRRGARWVLVSQGRDAALAFGEGKFHRFRPPRVETLNPIGSGDCLAAGVAHAVVKGSTALDAIRLGMACGAENARTLLPGTMEPAGVEELLPQVTVEGA